MKFSQLLVLFGVLAVGSVATSSGPMGLNQPNMKNAIYDAEMKKAA